MFHDMTYYSVQLIVRISHDDEVISPTVCVIAVQIIANWYYPVSTPPIISYHIVIGHIISYHVSFRRTYHMVMDKRTNTSMPLMGYQRQSKA